MNNKESQSDIDFNKGLQSIIEQLRRFSAKQWEKEPMYPTDPQEEERRLNARLIDPVYQALRQRYNNPAALKDERIELEGQLAQRLWELMTSPITPNLHSQPPPEI